MSAGRDVLDEGRLGARLRAIEFPEAAGLAHRVIDRHRSRAARGRGVVRVRYRVAAVALAALLLVLGGLVALPGGRDALATAPVVGPVAKALLRLAGLDAAGSRVAPLEGQATSSGFTVSLLGGYADNQRTVVIVHVDPAAMPELPVTLTPANGPPLTEPVISPTTGGDVALVFGPIARPDPKGNALTLHFSEVGPILAVGQPPSVPGRVPGDWTLRLTLTVDRSAAVPAPRPGRVGSLAVSFTASAVGTDVQVSAHLSGATIGQLEDMASDAEAAKGSTATPGPGALFIQLVDETGRPVHPLRSARSRGATARDFTDDEVWSVPGPGTYLIVVRWKGQSLVRTLVVP